MMCPDVSQCCAKCVHCSSFLGEVKNKFERLGTIIHLVRGVVFMTVFLASYFEVFIYFLAHMTPVKNISPLGFLTVPSNEIA